MLFLRRSYLIINKGRYIRSGKYKDLVYCKDVLRERSEKVAQEENNKREKELSFLELLNMANIKTSNPKKHSRKKSEHKDDMNKATVYMGKNSAAQDATFEKRAQNCRKIATNDKTASVKSHVKKRKRSYRGNIFFKKKDVEGAFKNEECSNHGEDATESDITQFDMEESKRHGNDCSVRRHLILWHKMRPVKKYVHLDNYKGTNSYINKKYLIVPSEPLEKGDFDISEKRSMKLLDDITKKNNVKSANACMGEDTNCDMGEDTKELQKDYAHYENKSKIIKRIYKASINHVRDENLWKKYVQNTFTISAYLDAPDIVILFWCFSKIGYRDNRLVHLLCSILLKKINTLSCCAIALLLNSFKKLEIKKYDTIELLTNQFCFHQPNWTSQDIALVSNSLAFFYIYHKTFWKKCILKLQHNYYFSEPLHLCLVISAFARLDIREGNILLCLSRSAKRVAKDLSPNNLALLIHSFAKLKFHHPKFYNYLYQFVHKYLDDQLSLRRRRKNHSTYEEPLVIKGVNHAEHSKFVMERINEMEKVETAEVVENTNYGKASERKSLQKEELTNGEPIEDNHDISGYEEETKMEEIKNRFDLQSLVLLLFSCTCLISCTEQMILKLTYLVIPHKEHLGNHKIERLKYVSDYLQYVYPSSFRNFPNEIKHFYYYIDTCEIKRKKLKYCARWITEISRILVKMNVSHLKNIYINNICADIMLTDSNIIIKCLGPYSYYVNSLVSTSISDLNKKILDHKMYNTITLSYYEWNKLNDYEEKIKFLYAFGRNAANYFFFKKKEKLCKKEENGENLRKKEEDGEILCKKEVDEEKSGKNELEEENLPHVVPLLGEMKKCRDRKNGEIHPNEEFMGKDGNSLQTQGQMDDSLEKRDNQDIYFSDEDNEIIDFIKRGECSTETREIIDEFDLERIKKPLEVAKR
ncbi:RAP protein, putative [Plasmodium ovale]|uniref:RAP domain-containing protein n=2 Tax=Plasmodium ovale TaxID=36330 RepID=A0A1A8WAL5_PLAOA|nr:hypothetical protein, conserved [Plasmodium ovale curtisi]SCQ16883.1 RAP protein, putative [Plasmodium ovale]